MKKQGFTLIELMVVIVIMGILAAVAVPKLFGMIAKSKASEVGPAAGTYVKLQDAYVAENGTTVGSWTSIGYKMPNSTNFLYCGTSGEADCTANDGSTVSGYTAQWKATSVATLNDCAAASTWSLISGQNGSSGGLVNYTAKIENYNDCQPLTVNFCKLGTANSGACATN